MINLELNSNLETRISLRDIGASFEFLDTRGKINLFFINENDWICDILLKILNRRDNKESW